MNMVSDIKIIGISKSLALAAPLAASIATLLEPAAYIKFDGIDGEARDDGFEGLIKISYFKIKIGRS